MICATCGERMAVVDSAAENSVTYRRRKCPVCGAIVWTEEHAIDNKYVRINLNRVRAQNKRKAKGAASD